MTLDAESLMGPMTEEESVEFVAMCLQFLSGESQFKAIVEGCSPEEIEGLSVSLEDYIAKDDFDDDEDSDEYRGI